MQGTYRINNDLHIQQSATIQAITLTNTKTETVTMPLARSHHGDALVCCGGERGNKSADLGVAVDMMTGIYMCVCVCVCVCGVAQVDEYITSGVYTFEMKKRRRWTCTVHSFTNKSIC